MPGVQGWSLERLLRTIAVLPKMGSGVRGPEERRGNAGAEPPRRSGLEAHLSKPGAGQAS